MVDYREDIQVAEEFKKKFVDGLDELIFDRQRDFEKKRKEYRKDIMRTPEKYREVFKSMLGWPLVDHVDEGLPDVTSVMLAHENGYTIYRMTFRLLGTVDVTGLYFELDGNEKRPLVIAQHGGWGSPEQISNLYGDTENYNHMAERVLERGAHVFAPQLLLWNPNKHTTEYDRAKIDGRLKRVGSSITAVECYALMRILDYFEVRDNVLSFGMLGLSYGGFWTLYFSAIDTRIRSAISCAFFNKRDQYPWTPWTWLGAAEKFDDAEVAALVYPRKLCIQIGKNDPLFDAKYGYESYEELREICKDVGTDWVDFMPFDGDHEFCKDDAPIDKMLKHLWERENN